MRNEAEQRIKSHNERIAVSRRSKNRKAGADEDLLPLLPPMEDMLPEELERLALPPGSVWVQGHPSLQYMSFAGNTDVTEGVEALLDVLLRPDFPSLNPLGNSIQIDLSSCNIQSWQEGKKEIEEEKGLKERIQQLQELEFVSL